MINIEQKLADLEVRVKSLETKNLLSLNQEEIEGSTNATAELETIYIHGLGRKPESYSVVLGNIYVQDMTPHTIDIRSVNATETFKIIVR